MMKKLMRSTFAVAGFAALLLVGACSTTSNAGEGTTDNDDLVEVTQTSSVVPQAGPALVDSSGAVYSSSAAPGRGNPSGVGTNTNVNIVPERSSVAVVDTAAVTTSDDVDVRTFDTTTDSTMVDTTADTTITSGTTTRTETTTVTVPRTETVTMTSSSSADTQSTVDTDTTTTTETRTRMRKD
jgi:hypothetical protein